MADDEEAWPISLPSLIEDERGDEAREVRQSLSHLSSQRHAPELLPPLLPPRLPEEVDNEILLHFYRQQTPELMPVQSGRMRGDTGFSRPGHSLVGSLEALAAPQEDDEMDFSSEAPPMTVLHRQPVPELLPWRLPMAQSSTLHRAPAAVHRSWAGSEQLDDAHLSLLLREVSDLGPNDTACPICLASSPAGAVELSCGNAHRFHADCIRTWLRQPSPIPPPPPAPPPNPSPPSAPGMRPVRPGQPSRPLSQQLLRPLLHQNMRRCPLCRVALVPACWPPPGQAIALNATMRSPSEWGWGPTMGPSSPPPVARSPSSSPSPPPSPPSPNPGTAWATVSSVHWGALPPWQRFAASDSDSEFSSRGLEDVEPEQQPTVLYTQPSPELLRPRSAPLEGVSSRRTVPAVPAPPVRCPPRLDIAAVDGVDWALDPDAEETQSHLETLQRYRQPAPELLSPHLHLHGTSATALQFGEEEPPWFSHLVAPGSNEVELDSALLSLYRQPTPQLLPPRALVQVRRGHSPPPSPPPLPPSTCPADAAQTTLAAAHMFFDGPRVRFTRVRAG
eukprot:TRINITY_DN25609_c0_g1_i1.p1 TRINITY_DN25609_c0_g1~~TRINITY_DN25609_c0_g1_i1.p1  ORF type:complete len:561 (-),score=71.84 TRINITY_DN25609_c0_g1_i1:80-1762(-)